MPTANIPLISVTGLHVPRSPGFALRITRLRLEPATILCVAGPNGSGKTTFVECLAGLLQPPVGAITIADHGNSNDLRAKKALIGYIPDDEAWFVPELCAAEYFALLERTYREAGIRSDMKARIASLCKDLCFTNFKAQLSTLSHGNKKKVQIVAGLMHSPPVVIIDELRNGLDPLALKAAETIVHEEASRGACIIAATHDLWWSERVADEILLLINGKPVLHQPTSVLLEQYGHVESVFLDKVGAGV